MTCIIKEMDLTKLSKTELLVKCEELGITKCKSKNKEKLIDLINTKNQTTQTVELINYNSDEKYTNNIITHTFQEINKVEHHTNSSNNSLKFIDLFCGIGGFHQALAKLGFECVFASDIDENCRKTYKNNYNIHKK